MYIIAPCYESGEITMTINMLEGDNRLKNIFKDAIVEVLEERQDLFAEIVAEAIEDIGLVRAIREGEKTEDVSREEVFRTLQGE